MRPLEGGRRPLPPWPGAASPIIGVVEYRLSRALRHVGETAEADRIEAAHSQPGVAIQELRPLFDQAVATRDLGTGPHQHLYQRIALARGAHAVAEEAGAGTDWCWRTTPRTKSVLRPSPGWGTGGIHYDRSLTRIRRDSQAPAHAARSVLTVDLYQGIQPMSLHDDRSRHLGGVRGLAAACATGTDQRIIRGARRCARHLRAEAGCWSSQPGSWRGLPASV